MTVCHRAVGAFPKSISAWQECVRHTGVYLCASGVQRGRQASDKLPVAPPDCVGDKEAGRSSSVDPPVRVLSGGWEKLKRPIGEKLHWEAAKQQSSNTSTHTRNDSLACVQQGGRPSVKTPRSLSPPPVSLLEHSLSLQITAVFILFYFLTLFTVWLHWS